MDKWTILGIDKTKDKDAIKKAYRAKLVNVNPEDNQEGFMALRQAYDEAMYEADIVEEESSSEDKGLVPGTLEYELNDLYQDFNRRIDVSEWKEFLAREEFSAVDTADEAMTKLLVYLMSYNLVPQEVYKLFVEFFKIDDIKEELCERFPKGFISHILDNATYRDPINYYLFEGDLKDIDRFIDLYYGLDNYIRQQNVEEEKRLIDELDAMDIYHPYLELCKCRYELHKINKTVSSEEERREKYVDELKALQQRGEKLLEKNPDDFYILLFTGDIALIRKDAEGVEKHYGHMAELDPDDYAVQARLGDMYCVKEDYEAARDLYMKLIDINPYDDGARYGLAKANTGLIDKYNNILKEEPDNEKVKYDLVWCYYRNGMSDKCIEVLTGFTPSEENRCEYYDLLGRNYMCLKNYEKALEGMFAWKDAILAIPKEDNSEKALHHKSRFYYANYYIGECYISLKNYDEARKYLHVATLKNHEYIEYAYAALCRLEYETGCYEECLQVCEKIRDTSISFDAYLYMAKCFYQLNDYSNTVGACETAIRIARYFYEPYVILSKLYWECEEYDKVREVIKRFDLLGYPNDDIDVKRARLAMSDRENEKAIEIFQSVLDRRGTEEANLEDEDDYLNIYTWIAGCHERLDQEEKAITFLEQGLEEIPDDVFFLNRIANVCHVMGDFERSIKCANRILEVSQDTAYRRRAYDVKCAALACLKKFEEAKQACELSVEEFGLSRWFAIDYSELLVRMNDLDTCVKVMEKAIAETEDIEMLKPLYGNLCCFYGNEGYVEEAYRVYKEGIERIPEAISIHRSMGFVFLDHGRYEEAIELFKKTIELDTNKDTRTAGLLLLALSHIDDINKPEYKEYHEIAMEQAKGASYAYAYLKNSEYYRAIGEYEKAIECCNLALEEKREKDTFFAYRHDAWQELAYVYFEMGDYAKSKECYEKAIDIFGHNQLFIDGVAKCEKKMSQES